MFSPLRRPLLVALVAAAGLWSAGGPKRVHAQDGPDPRIDVWLHSPFVGLQTRSGARPTLRLYAADGNLRTEVTPEGSANNGRWQIDLFVDPFSQRRLLVEPGDRIELDMAGETTLLEVPRMEASADVETEIVRGWAPPGVTLVGVLLHRDPFWFDAPANFETRTMMPEEDGSFAFDYSEETDLRAGYWGEAVAILEGGHYLIQGFAPPSVSFRAGTPVADLRMDAGSEAYLTLRNRIDTELFRSGQVVNLGGARFAVALYQDGNPDFGAYAPSTDERLVLVQDGAEVISEPVPLSLASLDRQNPELWGLAEPGARVVIPPGDASRTLFADAAGNFSVALQDQLGEDAATDVIVYPGGAVSRGARAFVPNQDGQLYGNRFSGQLGGWGRVIGEHWRDGQRLAWEELEVGSDGEFLAEFRDDMGEVTAIRPGDRLVFEPELGRRLEVWTPELSASVDASSQRLEGLAPPDSELLASVYYRGTSIFDPNPYNRQTVAAVAGRSDAEGRFSLDCADAEMPEQDPDAECRMVYGLVVVRQGDADFFLQWQQRALFGVGVTEGMLLSRGTAGLPVQLELRDAEGNLRIERDDIIRPLAVELPAWELPLIDLLPEGVQAGMQVSARIGERNYDLEVPAFSMEPDVVRNQVRGTGPPGMPIQAVAYSRGQDNRPPAVGATGVINASGRWQLTFGFDLRSGDDIEVYIVDDDRFVWWSQDAIPGIDPPTRVPPSPTPFPSATPEPTAVPESREIYLPRLDR